MWKYTLKYIFLTVFFTGVLCQAQQNLIKLALEKSVISTDNYVFWKNATVPFYVNPENFDHEQTIAILQALSMFSFRTCVKFLPVLAAPASNEHVLVFENHAGVRRCVLNTMGHSVFEPHRVVLGYDCLKSPQIDMMIMRALGLPFEHNRINRNIYIDVLEENIETGSINLFTKESMEPIELRAIPYDVNSVMHFGTRDFSKNGHRTILFKDHNIQQNRAGLTKLDIRKIEIVYEPQCRVRDRLEKIELCQSYPGVARKKREVRTEENPSSKGPEINRKKREVDEIVTKSLRVNPDITPPPDAIKDTLTELGIDDAVQDVVEQVHKVSALALKNARDKYCNNTKPNLRSVEKKERDSTDILGIIEVIAHYAQDMVDNAVANLTKFCEESESIDVYQRARCSWNDGSDRCRQTYRSTKSGAVKYSTQHRPIYYQSTNIRGIGQGKKIYALRSNDTEETTTEAVNERRKRETGDKNKNRINIHDEHENMDKSNDDRDATVEKRDNEDRHVEDKKDTANVTVEKKDNAHRDVEVEQRDADRDVMVEKRENADRDVTVEKRDHQDIDVKEGEEAGNIDKQGEKDDKQILRSWTTISPIKVYRYEPVRRQGRRSRVRYLKEDDDMDLSSLSIDTEKPKPDNRQSEEDKATTKRRYREPPKEDKRILKERKVRNRKGRDKEDLEKRDREESGREKRYKEERYREESDREKRYKEERDREESDREKRYKEERDIEGSDREKSYKERDTEKRHKEKKNKEVRERKDKKREDAKVIKEPTERHKKPKRAERNTPLPDTVELSKANQEFYNDRMWPGGVVRYIIKEDIIHDTNDLRRRLEEVNSILKRKTCVKLKEITEQQAQNYEDYVVIDNSPDYVTGRVGGRQRFGSIELFRGDQHRQHTAMMVMAMLGFYFEVSRHDRDKHVRVHMRHVRPDKLHHFEKIREDATLALPYDYYSATHPAWQYWRQIGKTGISTVATYKQQDPDGSVMKSMGQNSKLLSDIDIIKINSVYGNKCFRNILRSKKETLTKTTNKKVGQIREVTAA